MAHFLPQIMWRRRRRGGVGRKRKKKRRETWRLKDTTNLSIWTYLDPDLKNRIKTFDRKLNTAWMFIGITDYEIFNVTVFWLHILKESFRRDTKMFTGKMIPCLGFVSKSFLQGEWREVIGIRWSMIGNELIVKARGWIGWVSLYRSL